MAVEGKNQLKGYGLQDNAEEVDVLNIEPIGVAEIKKAYQTFKKYKEGKKSFDERLKDNEEWFKMRHWKQIRKKRTEFEENEPMPASGWTFNCVISKHADMMDAYPEPNILPREEGDKKEAKILTSIIPCILELNHFFDTYSDCSLHKTKSGQGVYGVFWDQTKTNGIGDISIEPVDALNLVWEPGIRNIQDSRNVFFTHLVDVDVLEGMYPEYKGKFKVDSKDTVHYKYDENISLENKCTVIDWYYKKFDGVKSILHYAKFCGEILLFSSENEEARKSEVDEMVYDEVANSAIMNGQELPPEPPEQKGWYNHGLYPFVIDVLFPEEGMPTGFGLIDVCKEAQESIDRLNNDIEIASRWGARPRFFVRGDGGINEEEFNDLSKPIVHVNSNLGSDSVMPIQTNSLDSIYLTILANKVDELKEVTGNRDVTNGGTTAGVTTASGIAALMESSGKTSRDMIMKTYRAFSEVCYMVIELIRQFYDMPRKFRIVGEAGAEQFLTYTNDGLRPQLQPDEFGEGMGYRSPIFDIKVSAQKSSPYAKVSQNELALQFYNLGFFNPQMTDQALACLDMMDFDGKDGIMQKIQMNGTLYQQLMMMQQQMMQLGAIVDDQNGTNLVEGMAQQFGMEMAQPEGGSVNIAENDGLGGLKQKEHAYVRNARAQAQSATSPR